MIILIICYVCVKRFKSVKCVSMWKCVALFLVLLFDSCSSFLYCKALVNTDISSLFSSSWIILLALLHCSHYPLLCWEVAFWWGHESDLYFRRRDHFHSTGYLFWALSWSTALTLRSQRHPHNEKWCLSPHISNVWGAEWDNEPTHLHGSKLETLFWQIHSSLSQ